MPSTHTSTLKPAGTLSVLTGRSLAGRPVMWGAKGCRVDSDNAAGLPCCHEGGGEPACCASAGNAKAAATANAIGFFIRSPLERLLELKRSLDANGHVAARRGLVIAPVGLVDDDRSDVIAVADVIDAGKLRHPPACGSLRQARGYV